MTRTVRFSEPRLHYQPLFREMSPRSSPKSGGTQNGPERAAGIEPSTNRVLLKKLRVFSFITSIAPTPVQTSMLSSKGRL